MTNTEADNQPIFTEPKLEHLLVVISPDAVQPSAPQNSTLISRAITIAKATGCEIELFHVCHDDSLSKALFSDAESLQRAQRQCLERDATLMAELVIRLNAQGVTIRHDTRWDHPRTDAILRKIEDSQPDLVMKQSRDYGYVMGLMGNTDWDLIRQSPAHLWFVTEGGDNTIERLITAVGTNPDEDEMIAAPDYNVFRLANFIAENLGATNFPVHAYQVPMILSTYGAYAPNFGGVAPVSTRPMSVGETRSEIAKKHGQSIRAFAEFFNLDPENVHLAEGHPSDVLPQAARSLDANLIVMGARNLTRWERVFRTLNAEPVLADAPCDIVFVKGEQDAAAPVARSHPAQGTPAYDLQQAIVDPQRTFGSPKALAEASELTVKMRKRILQLWEQDIRAQMTEESEGGPIRATKAHLLDAINTARTNLVVGSAQQSDTPAELTG